VIEDEGRRVDEGGELRLPEPTDEWREGKRVRLRCFVYG